MTTRRLLLGAALAAPAASSLVLPAFAQAPWPQRPVRFVVAFAPGGVVDQIGRLLAEHLGEIWGQSVVVENRPGAGGNIGTQVMARAAPDGYSALVNSSTFATNLSLFRNPGYREEDFAAASVVAGTPQLLAVRADGPFRTLADVVETARRRPVTYGTPGVGSPNQFLTELLFRRLGITDTTHVPYSGAGPAMTALIAGDIDVAAAAVASAMTLVRGGRARGIAVMAERRSQALPDVPTVAEAGFEPLVGTVWAGVFFPTGTPQPVLERVNADSGRVMQRPAFQQRLAATGFEPIGGDLPTTQRFVASEIAKWREIVRTLGVQAG
jgi:tripartite-type tricarboxylate transporter receptor subunit TctC